MRGYVQNKRWYRVQHTICIDHRRYTAGGYPVRYRRTSQSVSTPVGQAMWLHAATGRCRWGEKKCVSCITSETGVQGASTKQSFSGAGLIRRGLYCKHEMER